ncbi:MAG: ABC transporter substrate-binding protein [Carbonactinosporaceae bacterium]
MASPQIPSRRLPPRHRRNAAGALLLATTLAAASCTTGGSGEPGGGSTEKTFDIAIGIELDTLDPAQMTTTTVANVVDYSVETLTTLGKSGETQPGLAESWEVAEDGRSVTLQLREGVTFQDGTKLDAEAVKFNLERLLDPKVEVPQRAPYTSIESVETTGDMSVRLDLSRPDPALPSALSASTAGLVSPASVEKEGNSYKNIVHPVGTGPYSFVKYQKGDRVVFEKYGDYWGRKPHFEQVAFRIVPEAATRESLLRAGQADMIVLPPVPDLKALQQSPETNVLLAPSDRTVFMAFKTPQAPLDDPKVRQAINYAVNKDSIVKNVLFGAAEPMDAPVAPTIEGHCSVGSYDYDPEKAKQLLADAGVKNLSLTVGTPTGRYLQDKQAADAVAGNLRDVGVDVQLRTMDWASYLAAINVAPEDQKFDTHVLGWAPAFLDASQQMLQFRTDQGSPEGLATSHYSNPKVDSLVARADRELDSQKRRDLYCQAWKTIWADAPWIFLWVQKYPIAYSSDVTGVSYLPNEKFDAVYARPKG